MPQIDADGEKDRQTHALVDAAMTGKASCRDLRIKSLRIDRRLAQPPLQRYLRSSA